MTIYIPLWCTYPDCNKNIFFFFWMRPKTHIVMAYWWVFWVEVYKYFEDFIVGRCWLGFWVGYSVVLLRITYHHSYKLNCDKSVMGATSMTNFFFVWKWNLNHNYITAFLSFILKVDILFRKINAVKFVIFVILLSLEHPRQKYSTHFDRVIISMTYYSYQNISKLFTPWYDETLCFKQIS